MSDFLFKAKDQYYESLDKYSEFKKVFDDIKLISEAKNYFRADLFNIEEILSIIEVQYTIYNKQDKRDQFVKFITDVIDYYTPLLPETREFRQGNWYDYLAQDEGNYKHYAQFVACLLGLKIRADRGVSNLWPGNLHAEMNQFEDRYAVITLNYDMVLENILDKLRLYCNTRNEAIWNITGSDDDLWDTFSICKLHGSTHDKSVIPPTWFKQLGGIQLTAWRNAHRLINEATDIRILGYSLPVTDSYIKYLFKSGIVNSRNVKSFDVICLDTGGIVEQRYRDFVEFPRLRFISAKIEDYIDLDKPNLSEGNAVASYNMLESKHNSFMNRY